MCKVQLGKDKTLADDTGIHRQKGRSWGEGLMRGKEINLVELDPTVRHTEAVVRLAEILAQTR